MVRNTSCQKSQECSILLNDEFPTVPKGASITGFTAWSAYNLLILKDNNTDATFLFTDLEVDRLIRLWNGLGLYDLYLSNYGLGEPDDGRHQKLVET